MVCWTVGLLGGMERSVFSGQRSAVSGQDEWAVRLFGYSTVGQEEAFSVQHSAISQSVGWRARRRAVQGLPGWYNGATSPGGVAGWR
jgi:hypothetical protein